MYYSHHHLIAVLLLLLLVVVLVLVYGSLLSHLLLLLLLLLSLKPEEMRLLPRKLPSSREFTPPTDDDPVGTIIKPISVHNEKRVLRMLKDKAIEQVINVCCDILC